MPDPEVASREWGILFGAAAALVAGIWARLARRSATAEGRPPGADPGWWIAIATESAPDGPPRPLLTTPA